MRVLAFALVVMTEAVALAQPPDATPPDAPSSDAASAPVPAAAAPDARKRGDTAFAEKRYADAIAAYREAYAASPDPALLLLIGDAQKNAGNCELAVDSYRRYQQARGPSPETVGEVEPRIASCRATSPPIVASGSDSPQPPLRASKTLMFGLSLGFGSAQHAGTAKVCNCDQDRRGGAFELYFGWHSPRLALFVALNGESQRLTTRNDGPVRSLIAQAVTFNARSWLVPRAYVEGAVGLAKAEVPPFFCESGIDAPPHGCDPDYESKGLVLAAAAGFELVHWRGFALAARARAGMGFYDGMRQYTMTFGLGLDFFR